MNNAQTFSKESDQYARHRPQYPEDLFAYLNELCIEHEAAWDCATGNGQAALSLANYFLRIEATDVSTEQIQHALPHSHIHYSVSPAEHTSFHEHTFDLVTVATAVHWFDQPQFFREINRVLKPGGILAIWGYSFFHIDPDMDVLIRKELLDPIDSYWASGNRQVMSGYRDLVLPFDEIEDCPTFAISVEWTLSQFLAYTRTWSAVKRYMTERGVDPVAEFEPKLTAVWGTPDEVRVVKMPIAFRASRKSK